MAVADKIKKYLASKLFKIPLQKINHDTKYNIINNEICC